LLESAEELEILERQRLRILIVDRLRFSDILDLKTEILKKIWDLLKTPRNNKGE
jgi:hypothetical protein